MDDRAAIHDGDVNDRSCHSATNFAVMHHAAFPGTVR